MNKTIIITLVLLIYSILVIAEPEPVKILQHVDSTSTFAITGLEFAKNKEYLISAGFGIKFWNASTWDLEKTYNLFTEVFSLSNDNSLIVFSSGNVESHLLNVQSGEILHTVQGHIPVLGSGRNQYPNFIISVAISNSNKYLVTIGNDQTAILWDIETKNLLHQFSEGNPIGFEISHTTFSSDESLVAFGHSFYSTSTFEKVFDLIDPSISNDNLSSVSFSRSNKYFYSVGGDGYIRIWDWENKSLIIKKEIHSGLFEADITSDDKYLVSVGSGNFVKIVDLDRQSVISEFKLPEPGRSHKPTISIHPNGDYFAVGGAEGKIFIYDLQEVLASQSQVKEWKDYE